MSCNISKRKSEGESRLEISESYLCEFADVVQGFVYQKMTAHTVNIYVSSVLNGLHSHVLSTSTSEICIVKQEHSTPSPATSQTDKQH